MKLDVYDSEENRSNQMSMTVKKIDGSNGEASSVNITLDNTMCPD